MATSREPIISCLIVAQCCFLYTAAPTGDELLTPDDAVNVLEEILEAQKQSYVLGLKLEVPLHVVDSIYDKYWEPRDRLLHILIEFTKQVDPRPTWPWRAIVDALKSPAINLPRLAIRVEVEHLPDPTVTHDASLETTSPTGKHNVHVSITCAFDMRVIPFPSHKV